MSLRLAEKRSLKEAEARAKEAHESEAPRVCEGGDEVGKPKKTQGKAKGGSKGKARSPAPGDIGAGDSTDAAKPKARKSGRVSARSRGAMSPDATSHQKGKEGHLEGLPNQTEEPVESPAITTGASGRRARRGASPAAAALTHGVEQDNVESDPGQPALGTTSKHGMSPAAADDAEHSSGGRKAAGEKKGRGKKQSGGKTVARAQTPATVEELSTQQEELSLDGASPDVLLNMTAAFEGGMVVAHPDLEKHFAPASEPHTYDPHGTPTLELDPTDVPPKPLGSGPAMHWPPNGLEAPQAMHGGALAGGLGNQQQQQNQQGAAVQDEQAALGFAAPEFVPALTATTMCVGWNNEGGASAGGHLTGLKRGRQEEHDHEEESVAAAAAAAAAAAVAIDFKGPFPVAAMGPSPVPDMEPPHAGYDFSQPDPKRLRTDDDQGSAYHMTKEEQIEAPRVQQEQGFVLAPPLLPPKSSADTTAQPVPESAPASHVKPTAASSDDLMALDDEFGSTERDRKKRATRSGSMDASAQPAPAPPAAPLGGGGRIPKKPKGEPQALPQALPVPAERSTADSAATAHDNGGSRRPYESHSRQTHSKSFGPSTGAPERSSGSKPSSSSGRWGSRGDRDRGEDPQAPASRRSTGSSRWERRDDDHHRRAVSTGDDHRRPSSTGGYSQSGASRREEGGNSSTSSKREEGSYGKSGYHYHGSQPPSHKPDSPATSATATSTQQSSGYSVSSSSPLKPSAEKPASGASQPAPAFKIPKNQPPRSQQKAELLLQLKKMVCESEILQLSKERDRVGENDPIYKEGSFIKKHLSDWWVWDEHGNRIQEPRAPKDVPLLEEDFAGRPDHDARWWGVRLTEHDYKEAMVCEGAIRGLSDHSRSAHRGASASMSAQGYWAAQGEAAGAGQRRKE